MYVLKVETLEVGTKDDLKKRFKSLEKLKDGNHTCIDNMVLFDNRTGEIIDEYPRLQYEVYNN